MGVYATVPDIELAWKRQLDDADVPHVDYLIGRAERLVRDAVPGIAERITADRLEADTVKDVITDMVLRVLRNPDGYRYEMAGDYAYQRDTSIAGGAMLLAASERRRLQGLLGVTSVPVGDDALPNPFSYPPIRRPNWGSTWGGGRSW